MYDMGQTYMYVSYKTTKILNRFPERVKYHLFSVHFHIQFHSEVYFKTESRIIRHVDTTSIANLFL